MYYEDDWRPPSTFLPSLKKEAVAIVGTSPASREMANRESPEVEIWGLYHCRTFLKRMDRVFEIHNQKQIDFSEDSERGEWFRTRDVPVYVSQPDHGLPTGILYPFVEIGFRFRDYWSNTIAYMIALAVHEGFKEIHIWGVDMAMGTEYAHERPCVEFWLGLAAGCGIVVTVPDSSPLLKTSNGTYGISERIGVFKEQLSDELGSLERQRLVTEDPDVLQAINGAKQMALSLLGKVDPDLKDARIEYDFAGVSNPNHK